MQNNTLLFNSKDFFPVRENNQAYDPESRTVSGTVEHVICYKEESGWGVVSVNTDEGVRKVTGIMQGVRAGMSADFTGRYIQDRYGLSFKADSFVERLPSDVPGIEKYLASGLIRNIGPKLAAQIVAVFGEDTLDVLDREPERLNEVFGIGKKRVESIIASVKEQKEIRTVMIWLKRYDIPNTLAAKIYKTYGDQSVKVLENNPYVLSDDIKGVGFRKADEVATKLGILPESDFRIRSGIRACLEDAAEEGNTCMDENELIRTAAGADYLAIDPAVVLLQVKQPAKSGIVTAGGMAFLPKYYHAEDAIADRLTAISRTTDRNASMPDIAAIEHRTGLRYSDRQREAINTALVSKVTVITGGPGTGKTASTNAIISELEEQGREVLLAAPTGRAAKRMTEVTGRPASTIHRLLGFNGGQFEHNRDMPLKGDVLIVDETSMIDTLLMRALLEAVPDTMHLVMVGDIDQLPSVGAGCVLRDIIDSGRFSTVRLDTIFRQARDSDIITGAHAVNHGTMPRLDNRPGTDLWMFRTQTAERTAQLIAELVRKRIPEKFGHPTTDIQVLTPMRREGDIIGATELNILLQGTLNPNGRKVAERKRTAFLAGDRIMQTKNNYDKELFNGDIGTVVGKPADADEDNAVMEADFDGRRIRLTQAELQDIELAYACTVHKSQGSEYPVVVMPVSMSHYVMLKRNLLYTGITRARKQCILVGTDRAVAVAVHQEDTARRNTQLKERIEEHSKSKTQILP